MFKLVARISMQNFFAALLIMLEFPT